MNQGGFLCALTPFALFANDHRVLLYRYAAVARLRGDPGGRPSPRDGNLPVNGQTGRRFHPDLVRRKTGPQ